MPSYRNDTLISIRVPDTGDIVVPGQVYETREILVNLQGLTLIDQLPIWNPFIISGEYSGTPSADVEIPIPETSNGLPVINFTIDISVMSGSIKVFFTDKVNFGTPLVLSAGIGYTTPVFRRKVNKVILQFVRSGTVRVNVNFPEEMHGTIYMT